MLPLLFFSRARPLGRSASAALEKPLAPSSVSDPNPTLKRISPFFFGFSDLSAASETRPLEEKCQLSLRFRYFGQRSTDRGSKFFDCFVAFHATKSLIFRGRWTVLTPTNLRTLFFPSLFHFGRFDRSHYKFFDTSKRNH